MKVLHAYNQHRGGGGSNNATQATIDASSARGIETAVFTRRAGDLPSGLRGRLQAGLTALYGRATVRQFGDALDSFKPDVVHVHEIFPLVPPWILPECTRRKLPVVMSCVDYRMTCPVVTHLRDNQICTACLPNRQYQAALSNCRQSRAESVTMALYGTLVHRLGLYRKNESEFIMPSEFTRSWMLKHLDLPPDRVTAVAPVVASPPTAADAGVGGYVAFAGRFSPEKGIQTLLDAAKLTGLPVKLARNENSLVTCDVPARMTVVTKGREDLARFYREASMVVVPSLWFETFGLVGAEAMSHGIPVLAAKGGAVQELVEHGVDGLHFEVGDAASLAAGMLQLWNDPALRRRLGAAARSKAEARWNADRHFEQVRDIYERALRTAGGEK